MMLNMGRPTKVPLILGNFRIASIVLSFLGGAYDKGCGIVVSIFGTPLFWKDLCFKTSGEAGVPSLLGDQDT